MDKQEATQLHESLLERGFDLTEIDYPGEDWLQAISPRCSQCEALVINSMACHETGCPHSRATL